jgi:tetratricopeptide (TPR) repeat protein
MRYAAAVVGVLAGTAAGRAQPVPAPAAYRDVIATYIRTGDAAIAVKGLTGWDWTALDVAVADVIKSQDAVLAEAAALLHLEIGVSIVGMSAPNAEGYLDQGARLIDSLVPVNPDVRRNLGADRLNEIAKARTTWLGVAGSAFLSVNDVFRARPLFAKALKITPKSPAILTLQGAADEIDGVVFNPDDVESLIMKNRASRERTRLWLSAQQLYRLALGADPEYPLAHIRLGRVEFLFRNMKAAAASLQKGKATAQEASHRYLAAMFLGAFLQEQKDLAGARSEFERALEIAPRSQNATVALAYLELISGRPDHAQALARGYVGAADSDDSWWAYKNGTLDQAGLRWLRKRVHK